MGKYAEIKITYSKMKAFNAILCCHAINNEHVYFNHAGLKHLIGRGEKTRPMRQITSRVKLFKYVETVICSKNVAVEYRVTKYMDNSIEYWGLTKTIQDNLIITVVLRKKNFGKLHFYSVFKRR